MAISIGQIDDLLPQTQCGDCGFQGCLPYAMAIAKGDAEIDQCLPGGIDVLQALAQLLQRNAKPFIADMQKKAKPAQVARIDEDRCIGCTKCIQACPVDAIVGSSKHMHTVIASECTGCELCIEPCPMDCILLEPLEQPGLAMKQAQATLARQRYTNRTLRHQRLQLQKRQQHKNAQFAQTNDSLTAKREAIANAIARAKAKKNLREIK